MFVFHETISQRTLFYVVLYKLRLCQPEAVQGMKVFSLFSFIISEVTKSCSENVTQQINLSKALWFDQRHFN